MKLDISGAPVLVAGEVIGDVVRLVGRIMEGAPSGDARMMPFAPSGKCKVTPADIEDAVGGSFSFGSGINTAIAGWEIVPASGPVHPEYAAAFGRLDTIAAVARACGVADDVVTGARAIVARAINAGVYQKDGGFVCMAAERPTVGQVEALLSALSERLRDECQSGRVAAIGQAVREAEARPSGGVRSASVSPLLLLGGAGVLAAVWWTLRGAA